MKPLYLPLKFKYFDQFLSGEKDTEYRRESRLCNDSTLIAGRDVIFTRGYTKNKLHCKIKSIKKEFRSCKAFIDCYGSPGYCYAIRIEKLKKS